jgi:hypothetical protein
VELREAVRAECIAAPPKAAPACEAAQAAFAALWEAEAAAHDAIDAYAAIESAGGQPAALRVMLIAATDALVRVAGCVSEVRRFVKLAREAAR